MAARRLAAVVAAAGLAGQAAAVWPFLPIPSADDWAAVMAARAAPAGEKAFMLLSHLFVLLPIGLAVWVRIWLLAALDFVGALASFGYHTCVTYDVCAGISVEVWRNYDYVTAPLMVSVTVMLVVAARDHKGGTARRAIPAVYLLLVLAVVFAQLRYPFSNYVLYVSGVASAVLLVLVWVLVLRPQQHGPDAALREPIYGGWLVLSILILAGGVVAFAWPEGETTWPHALAHVLFFLAQAAFIVALRGPLRVKAARKQAAAEAEAPLV